MSNDALAIIREGSDRLAAVLAATDLLLGQLARRADDEPAWFWFAADRTVGAIRRMQTHEATVHRVDAELAALIDEGID